VWIARVVLVMSEALIFNIEIPFIMVTQCIDNII